MKNFQLYNAAKYQNTDEYEKVEEGIYKNNGTYVTSLTFEMDNSRLGEEEACPSYMPDDCPLEDLLDHFYVSVSDFYEDLNKNSEVTCYLEFDAFEIEDIRKLLTLIGKQYYFVESDGGLRSVIE